MTLSLVVVAAFRGHTNMAAATGIATSNKMSNALTTFQRSV